MSRAAGETTWRTAGQTVTVFGGNLAGTAFGFLANILIMRALGPSDFGVVIVALTFLAVLSQLSGRGLEQAMVRCVAMFSQTDPARAEAACRTTHQLKLLTGILLAAVGVATAGWVTRFFIGPDASSLPLQVAAVASVAASLWGYTGACLQAAQSFAKFTMVQVASAGGRLVLTVALLLGGIMTPVLAMGATLAGYVGAAGLGYALCPRVARGWRGQADLRPVIWRYSRWLIVSSLIYLFYTRLDQLMLSRMAGTHAAGVYGASVTFIQLVDLLTASLLTVFLPQMCATTDSGELRSRMWTSLRVSAMLALPLLPALFIIRPAMELLLGGRFLAAIPIFTVIFPGAVVNMLTHPLQVIMHARTRTGLLTAMDVGVLGFNGAANWVAIGHYGMMGAAVVALLTRLLASAVLVVLVARELRNPTGPVEVVAA